ncbi:MAG: tetratricopeptide repeat protein [Pseudomonadota bacterium]
MPRRTPKIVRKRPRKASLGARLRPRLLALLLGTLLVLVLAELSLRAVGWAFTLRQEHANRAAMAAGATHTVLCLGESTTALGGEDAYPTQLGEVLRAWSGGGDFQVINGGVPGTNSEVLATRLSRGLEQYHPQVVVVMMGANDTGGAIPSPLEEPGPLVALLERSKVVRLARQLHLVRSQGDWQAADKHAGGPNDAQREADLRRASASPRAPLPPLMDLGAFLEEHDRLDEAEQVFRQALDRCPGCLEPQLELARHFERLQDEPTAEVLFREACAAHPESAEAFFGLGRILRKEERFEEAIGAFEQAVRLDERDASAWTSLGLCYDAAGRQDDAGRALRRGWEMKPNSARAFLRLADFYERQGDDDAMVAISKRATERPSEGGVIEGRIALYWARRGDTARADDARARADAVQYDLLPVPTREGYRRMLDTLSTAGVPLVAVQYPTRSARPLEAFFADHPEVAVVDNEALFREALAQHPYEEIFWDNCYGDFGHGTRLGNRMLAENVARTLFEGVFSGMGSPPD